MIGYLRGKLLSKQPTEVMVDVGGVGYRVLVPLSTYYALGEEGSTAEIHVHTNVRDDAIELYGFGSAAERGLFRRLIAISGIGPKLALAILSGLEPPDLLAAIEDGDTARIARTPGIGKKTAERLVLELRDKLPEMLAELGVETVARSPASMLKADLISALINLGYGRRDAERAAEQAAAVSDPEADFGKALKAALSALSV